MELETEMFEDPGAGDTNPNYSPVQDCFICGGSDTDCESKQDAYNLLPHAVNGLIRLLLREKTTTTTDSEGNNGFSTDLGLETLLRAAEYCARCLHELDEVSCLLERLQELKTTVTKKLQTCYGLRRKNADRVQKLRGKLLRASEAAVSSDNSIGSRVRAGTRRVLEPDSKNAESPEWTPNTKKRLRLLPFARDLLAPDPLALAQVQTQTCVKLEPVEPKLEPVEEAEAAAGFSEAYAGQDFEPGSWPTGSGMQWSPSPTPTPPPLPAGRKRGRTAKKKEKPKYGYRGKIRMRRQQMRKASAVALIKHKLAKLKSEGSAGPVNRKQLAQQLQLDEKSHLSRYRMTPAGVSVVLAQPRPNSIILPAFEVFICYACEHVSTSKNRHDEHRAQCKLNCQACGVLTTRDALQAHVAAAHPELPRGRGACVVCDLECKDLTSHHVQTHQTEFKCRTCGAEFTAFLEYNHHLRSHPELCLPPVQCLDCGRIFKNHNGVIVHASIKHRSTHAFQCDRPACGCTFPSAAELEAHVRRKHEGKRDFRCELCQQSFLEPWLLRQHMERHEGVEVKKNVCPQPGCGKAFRLKGKLSDHQAAVHGSAPKEHVCDQCGKSFPVKNYLYIHLRSHETPEEKRARRLKVEQAREERRRSGLPILTAKGRPRTRPVRERGAGGGGGTANNDGPSTANPSQYPQSQPQAPENGNQAPVGGGRGGEDQIPRPPLPPADKDPVQHQDQDQQFRILEDLLRQAAETAN